LIGALSVMCVASSLLKQRRFRVTKISSPPRLSPAPLFLDRRRFRKKSDDARRCWSFLGRPHWHHSTLFSSVNFPRISSYLAFFIFFFPFFGGCSLVRGRRDFLHSGIVAFFLIPIGEFSFLLIFLCMVLGHTSGPFFFTFFFVLSPWFSFLEGV